MCALLERYVTLLWVIYNVKETTTKELNPTGESTKTRAHRENTYINPTYSNI